MVSAFQMTQAKKLQERMKQAEKELELEYFESSTEDRMSKEKWQILAMAVVDGNFVVKEIYISDKSQMEALKDNLNQAIKRAIKYQKGMFSDIMRDFS